MVYILFQKWNIKRGAAQSVCNIHCHLGSHVWFIFGQSQNIGILTEGQSQGFAIVTDIPGGMFGLYLNSPGKLEYYPKGSPKGLQYSLSSRQPSLAYIWTVPENWNITRGVAPMVYNIPCHCAIYFIIPKNFRHALSFTETKIKEIIAYHFTSNQILSEKENYIALNQIKCYSLSSLIKHDTNVRCVYVVHNQVI